MRPIITAGGEPPNPGGTMGSIDPPTGTPPETTMGIACMLSLSGGFLDAFTFVGHGQVFANAMTGNVVLLGVFAAAGDWRGALDHIPPIFAFLAGVFMAQA